MKAGDTLGGEIDKIMSLPLPSKMSPSSSPYVTWQKGNKVAGGIEVTNQLIFKKGD